MPGPLEARKRLAKRRMMNVAVAVGRPPLDVGAVLGYGRALDHEDLKWQAPSRLPSMDAKAGKSLL